MIGLLLYSSYSCESCCLWTMVGHRDANPCLAWWHVRRGVQGWIADREHDDHPHRLDSRSGMYLPSCDLPTALYKHVTQYTPIDTLVFGGNFLHSYNVATRKWLWKKVKSARTMRRLLAIGWIFDLNLVCLGRLIPQVNQFNWLKTLFEFVIDRCYNR